jgi:hypothetical protein
MAKRNLSLPRATGCPRKPVEPLRVVIEPTPEEKFADRKRQTRARYAKWRAMYEADRMTVTEIATLEGVKPQSVSRALKMLGVLMRPKGFGEIVARLKRENAALRGRLITYRHRLAKYEEAA